MTTYFTFLDWELDEPPCNMVWCLNQWLTGMQTRYLHDLTLL